jgi:hypothetical protein
MDDETDVAVNVSDPVRTNGFCVSRLLTVVVPE